MILIIRIILSGFRIRIVINFPMIEVHDQKLPLFKESNFVNDHDIKFRSLNDDLTIIMINF